MVIPKAPSPKLTKRASENTVIGGPYMAFRKLAVPFGFPSSPHNWEGTILGLVSLWKPLYEACLVYGHWFGRWKRAAPIYIYQLQPLMPHMKRMLLDQQLRNLENHLAKKACCIKPHEVASARDLPLSSVPLCQKPPDEVWSLLNPPASEATEKNTQVERRRNLGIPCQTSTTLSPVSYLVMQD